MLSDLHLEGREPADVPVVVLSKVFVGHWVEVFGDVEVFGCCIVGSRRVCFPGRFGSATFFVSESVERL